MKPFFLLPAPRLLLLLPLLLLIAACGRVPGPSLTPSPAPSPPPAPTLPPPLPPPLTPSSSFLPASTPASPTPAPGAAAPTLAEARRGVTTRLLRREADKQPAPTPPRDLFSVVRYPGPLGSMVAYLSRPPRGDQADKVAKRPAIVWLTGGFGSDIDGLAWTPAPADNDQSAAAFWKSGVITMYPALRGANGNPGAHEGFYGEVDDVLAAAEFLAKQPGVDPARVYLGGHSTGATLALLVAECAPAGRFRAVFAFGPAADVEGYGPEHLPFDLDDDKETELRAPGRWLGSIQAATFVFEGTNAPGNLDELTALRRVSRNARLRFHPVAGANHFSILAPTTRLVARKILRDEGPTPTLDFSESELSLRASR